MLFNSWEFLSLFAITAVLYFNISQQYRAFLLLISSYAFYISWRFDFAVMMLAVTLINFLTGIKIASAQNKKTAQIWLWAGIILSLLPLLYLKYGNFFISNGNNLLSLIHSKRQFSSIDVILPVGISFFTFQALSYSLDVYYRRTLVEKNVINFSVFVAFFPQLVAGPIERSSNLLQQFRENHTFNRVYFIEGSKLFIWGLFKKVVIADRLSIYVDSVYGNPEIYGSSTLIVATLFFAFQIYCDFSGYTDMAIGTARILGFKLMPNFNLPYLSTSIASFWRRWHISLSSWFSDYVYKPLGGSRVKYSKWIFNILVVFVLSGFWHGANWTFIIWGFLHACYYFIENWGDKLLFKLNLQKIKTKLIYRIFKVMLVFTLVCFAWIFFRAESLQEAFLIAQKISQSISGQLYMGSSSVTFLLSLGLILFLVIIQILQQIKFVPINFSHTTLHPALQIGSFILLLIAISIFGISSSSFIYFQF